jgi:hypothetical protein
MKRRAPRSLVARKLLVASVGVATVSYVAIASSCSSTAPTGSPSPSEDGASSGASSGAASSSGATSSSGAGSSSGVVGVFDGPIGNLVAPPPQDSSLQDVLDGPSDAVTGFDVAHIIGNLLPPPIDSGGD